MKIQTIEKTERAALHSFATELVVLMAAMTFTLPLLVVVWHAVTPTTWHFLPTNDVLFVAKHTVSFYCGVGVSLAMNRKFRGRL